MNMSGMSMGGGMSGQGMSMGHMASTHATANLLPEWLGILGAVMFLLIAGAHLGHLAMTHGERRPWHVLHVGMAIGMAFMYAPARIDPFAIQAGVWQLLFPGAAALAALRWFAGYLGAAADNPLWLLTAIDLGAMVYMWSPGSFLPAMTWTLVAYLTVEAGLWVLNAYRVVDRGTPLIRWNTLTPAPDGAPLAASAVATDSLIGSLDISVSMTAMAVGMAFMLAVMQLMA